MDPSAVFPEDPAFAAGSRDRIRAINKTITREDQRIRARFPWLRHQSALALAVFFTSLVLMALFRELYLQGIVSAWLIVPLIAIPLSLLHELEHDLIHNLYFKNKKWMQHLMMAVIWLNKLGINPWFRRDIHLAHHKLSGQKNDIEERLIGLGLPWGPFRFLVTVLPVGSLFLIPGVRRDAPEFRWFRMIYLSLPAFVISFGTLQIVSYYSRMGFRSGASGLPGWGWQLAVDLLVILVLPGMLRQASIVFLSSNSHYYDDIPKQNVFYQNQVLNHWIFWPFQLFAFNFGSTHIIHHYVVDQPFFLRQWVAPVVHQELFRQGVRTNDFGTFRWRNAFDTRQAGQGLPSIPDAPSPS